MWPRQSSRVRRLVRDVSRASPLVTLHQRPDGLQRVGWVQRRGWGRSWLLGATERGHRPIVRRHAAISSHVGGLGTPSSVAWTSSVPNSFAVSVTTRGRGAWRACGAGTLGGGGAGRGTTGAVCVAGGGGFFPWA